MKSFFISIVLLAIFSIVAEGRNLGGGSTQLVVNDLGYRFATNRTRPMITSIASVNASLYSAAQQVYYTPDYDQTDPIVCIPNFWTPQVSAAPFEVRGDPGVVIEGTSIVIAGVYTQLKYGGAVTSYTFGTEPFFCYDAMIGLTLPANTAITIITTDNVPLGLRRPVGFNPIQAKYGDRGSQGSTTQSTFLTSGTIPTPAFGLLTRAPAAIVAKGAPNGQSIALIVGDSLAAGGAQNIANQTGARANLGFIAIGLDDDTPIIGRIPFGQFAVGSTNFGSLTANQFFIRRQLLAQLGNPFSVVVSNHGQNNVGGGYPALKLAAITGWNFLKSFYHGTTAIKLVQLTINPLTQSTNKWTSVAGQSTTAANTYPTGERYLYNTYVKTVPSPVNAIIDITPYWVDSTFVDRWKMPGRSSTLASNATTGNTSISVTGTPPIVGDGIIINVGAADAFYKNVGAVTGNDPYTVTFTVGQGTVSGTYLAGDPVVAVSTPEGIHDEGPENIDAAQGIIIGKSAGVFNFLLKRDLDPANNNNDPMWLEKAA